MVVAVGDKLPAVMIHLGFPVSLLVSRPSPLVSSPPPLDLTSSPPFIPPFLPSPFPPRGAMQPKKINIADYCKGRKVLLMGLPGAFTPT